MIKTWRNWSTINSRNNSTPIYEQLSLGREHFGGNLQRRTRAASHPCSLQRVRIHRGRRYLLHRAQHERCVPARRQHTSHGSEVVYVDSRPLYDPGTYDSYCARSRNERSLHDLPLLDRQIADPPVQRSIDREQRSAHTRGYLAAPSIWLRFHRCGSETHARRKTRTPRASPSPPRLDLQGGGAGNKRNWHSPTRIRERSIGRNNNEPVRYDEPGGEMKFPLPPLRLKKRNRPPLTRAQRETRGAII